MQKLFIVLVLVSVTLFTAVASGNDIVWGAEFEYLLTMDNAKITSCPMDVGTPMDCFDDDLNTLARSANVNPAWVQIEFPQKVESFKVRVSLGQPGYYDIVHNWWLETADSQNDLDNKTGSYKVVVPERFTKVDSAWDEVIFKEPVKGKVWKFNLKKTLGDSYVQIPELQLWSHYYGIKLDVLSFLKIKSVEVKNKNVSSSDLEKCFDENPSSTYNVEGPANILVDFKAPKLMINRIRLFVGNGPGSGENDLVRVEAADSIGDLESKSKSYKLVYDKKDNTVYEKWLDVYIHLPINKRYWNFSVNRVDSSSQVHISEIEFWVDQRYFEYPPVAPADLKVTGRNKSSATISWSSSKDSTGFVQYKIYRDGLLVASTKETSFTDNGLDPERAYTYYVKAYNISKKYSDQSSTAVSEPFSAQVIAPTQVFTSDMPMATAGMNKTETAAVPTVTITPKPTQVQNIINSSSPDNEKNINPEAVTGPGTEKNLPKEGSKSFISGFIIPISILVLVLFLILLIIMVFKMKKRMLLSQKKRETELNAIKQLLIEEKTDHVIELLGKKGKK